MKRLFLSGIALAMLAVSAPAIAADMPSRSPVYKAAPLPIFNWTGFYAGVHAGYGWGDSENLSPNGWFGGGQVGYNWQFTPSWVFGLEADLSGADISDSSKPSVSHCLSNLNRPAPSANRTAISGARTVARAIIKLARLAQRMRSTKHVAPKSIHSAVRISRCSV